MSKRTPDLDQNFQYLGPCILFKKSSCTLGTFVSFPLLPFIVKMERGAEASGLPRSRSRVKPFLATTVTLLLVAVAVCAVVAVFSANSGAPSGTAAALSEESLGAEARSLLVDSEPQPEDEGFVVDDSADNEVYMHPTLKTLK